MDLGSPSSITVKERMDRETIRFKLEWTIDKFKTLRKNSEYLRSVGITMRELGLDDFQGRWRIMVNPCLTCLTETGGGAYVVGVYLLLTDVSVESICYTSDQTVDAEFVIRVYTGKEADVNHVIYSPRQAEHKFSSKEQDWGFSRLITHDELFGMDETPGLPKDDCITIVIDVLMYGRPKALTVPEMVITNSSRWCQQRFVRRQGEALASYPRLHPTDFEIHSSDGQVFPTYRLLLTSHSPVFAAMLTHNSTENQLSRCVLDDIDGEAVGVLLDYVYGCDPGKVTVDNAEKVLMMADKYEILDLLAICEGILEQIITRDNAVHYLVFASQRNLDKLHRAAINVIPKNMDTVLQNGELREILQSDPELMQIIMEHCSKKGAP